MIRLLTAKESKEADQLAISRGMPSPVLMERAALSVLHTMQHSHMPLDRVLVIAGTGNNGGDGIAVARMLCEKGFTPDVLLLGSPEKYSEGMRHQMELLGWYRPGFVSDYEAGKYSVVVDAIFGVGLSREISGRAGEIINALNADRNVRVVAVDIPSGIHADNGSICGTAVRAERTVTFAYGKPGLYLAPGAAFAGDVRVAAIGIPEPDAEGSAFSNRYLLEQDDLKHLPERDPFGNKGTCGKLLVAAGSRNIYGAAYLAGRAALGAGAGMVRILTESANRIPLAAAFPEALISTYDAGYFDPENYQAALRWADGILAGPGLGTDEDAHALLTWILDNCRVPLVLDADALNLIAKDPALKDKMMRTAEVCSVVVTPHLVEMSRLTGRSVDEIRKNPFDAAEQFARENGVICVMKDARTVIACPDGTSYLMHSGTSALATAGSGDVLSGIIAALHTVSDEAEICAAALGDLFHGLAGRAAEEAGSARSATASDLIEYLPRFL